MKEEHGGIGNFGIVRFGNQIYLLTGTKMPPLGAICLLL